MKSVKQILGVALVASLLSACGTQNPNTLNSSSGMYNNGQAGLINGQGGCVPLQSGTFTFTATGASVNTAVMYAGNLPMNSTHPGQYGQVVMGASGSLGAGMIQYQPKQSSSGLLQLTASGVNGQATVQGSIQLNQAIIQQLMMLAGGNNYYGYNNYNSNLCVSSVAMSVVHTVLLNTGYTGYNTYNQYGSQGMGQINSALVYVTLNNGQTYGPIPFL